jgi:predicted O-methyltransferase YrrM
MRRLFLFVTRYVYAALSCAWLFALGWVSPRNRGLIFEICKHFGYRFPDIVDPVLPKAELSELIPCPGSASFCALDSIDGNISPFETLAINCLISAFQPKAIFEIGTFDGRTAMNMAANIPEGATVYTIDLPRSRTAATKLQLHPDDNLYILKEPGLRFEGTDYAGRIVQLTGDSATFDFSPYWGRMDLVFVDGAHSYDYVRNDSDVAFRLLRSGEGTIIWHDFAIWPGVTKYLNELSSRGEAGLRSLKGTSLAILNRGTHPRK